MYFSSSMYVAWGIMAVSHERNGNRYRFHFSGISICPMAHVGFINMFFRLQRHYSRDKGHNYIFMPFIDHQGGPYLGTV